MAIDLELVVAEGEILWRTGGNIDGISIADLATLLDPLIGSGGGITPADTDVSTWGFKYTDPTFATADGTKFPTALAVKDFVNSRGTLQSTDTGIIDVYTIGNITYLDVSGISGGGGGGGSFTAAAFDVHDAGDTSKIIKFDASSVPTATTKFLKLPTQAQASVFLVTEEAAQILQNKTLATQDGGGGTYGRFGDRMLGGEPVTIANLGAAVPNSYAAIGAPARQPAFGTYFNGAFGAALTPVLTGAEFFRLFGRVVNSSSAFTAADAARISAHLRETPTAAAQGADMRFAVPGIGTTAPENVLAVQGGADAATVGTVATRGGLIVGVGGVTTPPNFNGVDNRGAMSVGEGTYAMPNADVNDLVLPDCGLLSIDCTAMTANRTITGFTRGFGGRRLVVKIKGVTAGFDLLFAHENAGSAAANRIYSTNAIGLTLTAANGGIVEFVYDSVDQRWIPLALRA